MPKPTKKNPRPQNNPRFTEEHIAGVLKESRGLQALAAKQLGVSLRTITNYLNKFPDLKEILDEEREATLDMAEASLYRAVIRGEAWAVCFFLKTRGKSRGYVERTEVEEVSNDAVALKLKELLGKL